MRNTGITTWTTSANHRLGSQNPQDNMIWGIKCVGGPFSVAPGGQVIFNFNVTAPSTTGTYNFQWRMVQEWVEWFGDFTPNISIVVLPPPDLIVQSIVTNPAIPANGQNMDVTVTVKNQGAGNTDGPFGGFWVDIYKNLISAPSVSQAGDAWCWVNNLVAGSTATCTVTVSYTYAGTYKMWALADSSPGYIIESNENNNALSKDINVIQTYTLTVPKAGSGNGTVTSSPSGINCGADCLEIFNSGTVVMLTVTADDSSVFAGWSEDCSGTDSSITVIMDADKTCTATFNRMPDLVMTALTGSGGTFNVGDSFSVSDTVLNQGGSAAGNFAVRFFLSRDSAITGADISLTPDRSVSGLSAGLSSSGTTSVTIPVNMLPATYYIGACADAGGSVPETDETNNCTVDTSGTVAVVSPSIIDIGPTSNDDKNPDVAYNSTDNQFLTVWESKGSIMGELRGGDGSLIKDDFVIFSGSIPDIPIGYDSINKYTRPAVTYTSNQDSYLVVAHNYYGSWDWVCGPPGYGCIPVYNASEEIEGVMVLATGSVATSTSLADTTAPKALDGRPDVATNTGNSSMLAVWREGGMIMGRLLNGDGSLSGSSFVITDASPGAVDTPAVTYQRSPNDDYLVVYKVTPTSGDPYIARRIVQPDGTVSGEMIVSDAGAGHNNPDVAYNESSDTYLVVWGNGNITGQRLDASGNKVGGNFVIKSPDCGLIPLKGWVCQPIGDPAVSATTDDNNFLTTFYKIPFTWCPIGDTCDFDKDLFGTCVDSTGGVGSFFDIFYDIGLYDQNPGLAYGSTPKKFMVAWEHEMEAGGTYDIYGKLVESCKTAKKLIVNKAGTGSGTVTSDPAGISCGTDCEGIYDSGTVVTLTAVSDSGSTFNGWSGDADCTDGVVKMDADKTCTATFNIVIPPHPPVRSLSTEASSGQRPLRLP